MRILICLFLINVYFTCYSQNNKQYQFSHYDITSGLLSNRVNATIQDDQRYIWIATANGIQRFDGFQFENFKDFSDVSTLFIDSKKRLWFTYGDSCIEWINTKTLKRNLVTIQNKTYHAKFIKVIEARSGIYLINQTNTHLYKLDERKNLFEPFIIDKLQEKQKINNVNFNPTNQLLFLTLGSKEIGIYDFNNCKLYTNSNYPILNLNTSHDYLGSINGNNNEFFAIDWPKKAGSPYLIYANKNKRSFKKFTLLPILQKYHEIHEIYKSRDNTTWIYGYSFLIQWNNVGTNSFTIVNPLSIQGFPLSFERILNIYEDLDNNLWLSTTNGLFNFNPNKNLFYVKKIVDSWQPKSNIEFNETDVTSFLQLKNKEILVATWGKGLFIYDSLLNAKPLRNNLKKLGNDLATFDLCKDYKRGTILIDLGHGKLGVYNEDSDKLLIFKPKAFGGATILQIKEDTFGNIWFGLANGKLFKRKFNSGNNYNENYELIFDAKSPVNKILLDKKGNTWVLADSVFLINSITHRIKLILNESYKNKYIGFSDIIQYNDSLFVVTGGKITVVNIKRFNCYVIDTKLGLKDNTAVSVKKDQFDKIWVGMLSGLSRIDFFKKIITYYSSEDGITDDHFEQRSAFNLSEKLFFGTSRGTIINFNPELFLQKKVPSTPAITSISINNKPLLIDSILQKGILELKNDNTIIEITISSFNYTKTQKFSYLFKLDGLDTNWISTTNKIIFNHSLPPGTYNLNLKTVNIDGIFSKTVIPLKIKVKKPFWATTWFYIILLILASLLAYVYYRIKIQRLLILEQMRSRIARDLHDDIGSTLSTITILSEIAKSNKNNQEHLAKISNYSSQLISTMNDIVWSINPKNDSMQRITARMREFLSNMLESKNINYLFEIEQQVYNLHLEMESRRNFYLIFKEAINNSVKYAKCNYIKITISLKEGKLHLAIEDDGIGFNYEEARNKGNGLINMEVRAKAVNGQVFTHSTPNVGTNINLEIPY